MPYAGPTHKPHGEHTRDYSREAPSDPFYSSWRWRKVRRMFLRRHPLCCNPHGLHTEPVAATAVDHVVPRALRPDLPFDSDNPQREVNSSHRIKPDT